MKTNIRIILIATFIGLILLFLLFSSMVITGALSNGGMMGTQRMAGISWMWIPTILSLGLVFMIGWIIFYGKSGRIQKNNL